MKWSPKKKAAVGIGIIVVVCLVAIIGGVIHQHNNSEKSAAQKNSFYVYYATCPICKRDLPKLDPNHEITEYEYTKDEAEIVNKIGFSNYEKLTTYRFPVKVTIEKGKIAYQSNPLK